jgi:hypothetical protein
VLSGGRGLSQRPALGNPSPGERPPPLHHRTNTRTHPPTPTSLSYQHVAPRQHRRQRLRLDGRRRCVPGLRHGRRQRRIEPQLRERLHRRRRAEAGHADAQRCARCGDLLGGQGGDGGVFLVEVLGKGLVLEGVVVEGGQRLDVALHGGCGRWGGGGQGGKKGWRRDKEGRDGQRGGTGASFRRGGNVLHPGGVSLSLSSTLARPGPGLAGCMACPRQAQ